eukprot:22505-Eustigmatos_ZCMA.PRE.1
MQHRPGRRSSRTTTAMTMASQCTDQRKALSVARSPVLSAPSAALLEPATRTPNEHMHALCEEQRHDARMHKQH